MRNRIALLLILLLAPALAAQGDDAENAKLASERLGPIFLDDSLKVADYDAYLQTLLDILDKGPMYGASRLALKRAMDIEPQLADSTPLYERLKSYADNDFEDCHAWAYEYADAYVELARKHDTTLSWKPIAEKWRGITEASFIGPFADGRGSCHDDVLPPEVMLDYGAEYEGAYGRVKWQAMKHYDDLEGELDLYRQQRWTGYGYYVATEFVSDEKRDVLLGIDVNGPWKVWVNGEPHSDLDARREDVPTIWTIQLKLEKGVNTVLIKVSAASTLQLRPMTNRGRPLSGVVVQAPTAKSRPVPVKPFEWSRKQHCALAMVDMFRTDYFLQEPEDHPLAHALLCLSAGEIRDRYAMRIEAGEQRETALSVLGDNPMVAMEYLRALDDSPLHSSSDKRKLTHRLTDELEEAKLLPVMFRRAQMHTSDERYADAIEVLEAALELAPQKWRVYLEMDKVFRDARWRMERERVVKLALKDAPKALPVLRAASRYYADNGALANEVAIDKRILELLPGDPDAHMSLMHTLTRMGEVDEALKHARMLLAGDPANEFLLGRLAEILAAKGNVSEALQTYETLAERSPQPERELFQAARVCLQLGREDAGLKYLERVLEFDPGHHLARRQLQLMRGESEDFWSAHAVGWDEAMQHDVSAEDFPRADSALVLDEMVQLVYADGSSVSYVHQVRKILTQEGVDVRGREQINGELITARTVKADGTVLEPIAQPGGLVEFPGVEIGAYLDIEYILRADGGPLETLDGDVFYFIDQNFAEPFAISRWVIIAPEKVDLNVVYHNLRPEDEGVEISQTREDGQVTYLWDVRNPRHPESEGFMPSPLEFIPWIECVQPRDWKDRARKCADDGLGLIMESKLIDEKTAELLSEHAEADDITKAEVLYNWINANLTTEGDAWNAHQALVSMAGDREELFVSMCAAAKLRMGFAQVDAPPPYKQDPLESLPRPHWGYPHNEDFETEMIVIENEDGERAWIDMQDRLRPFGELSSRQFAAPAIVWIDGEFELAHLPGGDREKDRFENRVNIQLNADGSAKLTGSITVKGERSFAMKEAYRTASYDRLCRELESSLAQHYKGFEVDQCRFPEIGDVGEPLVQEYDGSVRRLADVNALGMTLELPGEKLGRLLSILVGEQERDHDLVIDFDLVQTDEIRIAPPEGYAFSDIPRDLVFPTAPLVYSLKFRIEEGELVVTRKLVLGPGRFTPAEYPNLVEQVKKIKQSENSVLKLTELD